ncbi:MAG: glycosyltransferase family 2 protein [Candidatus Ancillula sp.]|jgi:GT2 family glycosyltransferase|nr:glycosyltransferase family 2 protein [Candidatus Ancillula sp.]
MLKKLFIFANAKFPRLVSACYSLKQRFFTAANSEKVVNTYSNWVQSNYPKEQDRNKYLEEIAAFKYQPLISVVMPAYNTNIKFLESAISSVLKQFYDNLEFIIVDDASSNDEVRKIIQRASKNDKRIKYKFLDQNLHIAGATNECFAMSTGEFVALLDHDDELWPNALFEVVKLLNEHPDADLIYTDEDKIGEVPNHHFHDYFKPDWNFELLRSINYIVHLSVIRKTLIDEFGGERSEFNGTQNWEFLLRLTRHTNKVYHIPKVVYSWRMHSESTAQSFDSKPYLIKAQERALTDDLTARGYKNFALIRDEVNNGWNTILKPDENPLVSILIPSKNSYKIINRCLESIFEKTTYQNFEVIVIDTGSEDDQVQKLYSKFAKHHSNFKVVEYIQDRFSYAETCNFGAEHANGEHLLMLNNDTEVVTKNYLEQMLGDSCREEVGAVGAMLLYPGQEIIQHAGVLSGAGGVASNAFSTMRLDHDFSISQHTLIFNKREVTAVTAACLMLKKSVFDAVGGFNPEFAVTYNDVDLCLRIRNTGLVNVYNPHVKLIHHESISLGRIKENKRRDLAEYKKAEELFCSRYPDFIKNGDPFLNKNFSRDNPFHELAINR